jgi:hypothetical protein
LGSYETQNIVLKQKIEKVKLELNSYPDKPIRTIFTAFNYTGSISLEEFYNQKLTHELEYYEKDLKTCQSRSKSNDATNLTPSPAPTPSTSPKLPPPLSKLTISELPPPNQNIAVYSSSTGEWRDTDGVKINPLYNV